MRNGQAYQQKTEKFSVSEEKKFGKIDSRKQVYRRFFPYLTCLKALTGVPPFVVVPQPTMVGSDASPLKSNPIY